MLHTYVYTIIVHGNVNGNPHERIHANMHKSQAIHADMLHIIIIIVVVVVVVVYRASFCARK